MTIVPSIADYLDHGLTTSMSQELAILVSASPNKVQVHLTAIRLIEQLLSQQVAIRSVFFYQDAVQVANRFNCPPSDEPQLIEKWQSISEGNQLELQTCVAASYRSEERRVGKKC